MKTRTITDCLSKSVINEYRDIIMSTYAPDHSAEYKAKMQELDKNFYKELDADCRVKAVSWIRHDLMRSAAAIILAFSLSLSALCVISPTVRATVSDFIKTIHSNFITYDPSGRQTDIPIESILTNIADNVSIPENYKLSNQYSDDSYALLTYTDDSQHILSITVISSDSGASSSGNISDGSLTETTIHNFPAELFTADTSKQDSISNNITWTDTDTGYLYSISAFLPPDELVSLATGIYS